MTRHDNAYMQRQNSIQNFLIPHSSLLFPYIFPFISIRSTSDIQSTPSSFTDNIPLISTRGDDYQQQNQDQEDDIIGEEVRPSPIDTTMDSRMQALHALLQDHTYVQMPKKVPTIAATATATASTPTPNATSATTSLSSVTAAVPMAASPASIMQSPTKNMFDGSSHTIPSHSTVSSPTKEANSRTPKATVASAAAAAAASTSSATTSSISNVVPASNISKASGPTLNIPFSYDMHSIGKSDQIFSAIFGFHSFLLYLHEVSKR